MVFSRWGVQGLAGGDIDDRAVAVPESGDALGHAQVLTARVRVPGGTGSGRESDGGDRHPLVWLVRGGDQVEPDIPGELVRRVLGGRLRGLDVHRVPVGSDMSGSFRAVGGEPPVTHQR